MTVEQTITSSLLPHVREVINDVGITTDFIWQGVQVMVDNDIRMRTYVVGIGIPHIHYYRVFNLTHESLEERRTSLNSVVQGLREDLLEWRRNPNEWFNTLFHNRASADKDRIESIKEEAERLGIKLKAPDIRMVRDE